MKWIFKLLKNVILKEEFVRHIVAEWVKSDKTKLGELGAEIILDLVYGNLDEVGQDIVSFLQVFIERLESKKDQKIKESKSK